LVEDPVPIIEAILHSLPGSTSQNRRNISQTIYSNVPICRQVFIHKDDHGKQLPFWKAIQRGVVDGIRILYVSPSPCILVPSSNIVYNVSCSYRIKDGISNVILEEDCGNGATTVYAYPRPVWKELHDLYMKPLSEGKAPYNTGVILMGPPGTGKSRLAKIMARYIGINVFTIDASILSKWVGESEQRIKEILETAIESQPSIIILDDAEWILLARSLASDDNDGMSRVRMNLQQILFDKMQEIYDTRKRVLFVATTNVKKDLLDPALIRHGRFGPPLLVPLPDLEAAKIIVKSILSDRSDSEIEKIAFIAVNAGLSVADTLALVEKVKRGGEPKPRTTIGGRGYTRIYVDPVKEFRIIEEQYKIPLTNILSRRSRLFIQGPEDIATALAIQLVYSAKKTVIKLVDIRHLDEAIHSANMLASVFIAPTRLNPDIQYYIDDNADVAIIWVGEKRPAVNAFPLGSTTSIISRVGIEASIAAVASYRGAKINDGIIEMIRRKFASDYNKIENIMRMISTTGIIDEKYFENMIAWMA